MVRAMSLHLASGQLPTKSLARASASMAQDRRDDRIWIKEGPGKIPGAAQGPLKDLTFAAKDLYDVSPAAPLQSGPLVACQHDEYSA